MDSHRTTTSKWQSLFRSTRFSVCLLSVIVLSLVVRTAAYNYDLSQSATNNAYNLNPLYKPVKQQPVKAKNPRALASITLPMAQSQQHIRTFTPESKNLLGTVPPLPALPTSSSNHLPFQSPDALCLQATSPNLCVLHAVFRI
ncbi:MAG: hypothetical protein MUF71_00085 [Candidatus Kapabacteria bacterium]|nr:hypothetical protein [Candidatus Kapabacteria bacterium]